jgi:hypothetical protein
MILYMNNLMLTSSLYEFKEYEKLNKNCFESRNSSPKPNEAIFFEHYFWW